MSVATPGTARPGHALPPIGPPGWRGADLGISHGLVSLGFVARDDLGVLDHDVSPTRGRDIPNPMRVLPNGSRSDDRYAEDLGPVEADIRAVKRVPERRRCVAVDHTAGRRGMRRASGERRPAVGSSAPARPGRGGGADGSEPELNRKRAVERPGDAAFPPASDGESHRAGRERWRTGERRARGRVARRAGQADHLARACRPQQQRGDWLRGACRPDLTGPAP